MDQRGLSVITRPELDLPHDPGPEPGWSENYLFTGFDPSSEVGFFHHLGRLHADPSIWRGVFMLCLPGGDVVVGKDYGRGGSTRGPASPSLSFTCQEPFARWHLTFDGVAHRTTTACLAGALMTPTCPVPTRFSAVYESSGQPWTSSAADLAGEVWADMHYEQGGRIDGEVSVGTRRLSFSGVAYRDHSTGRRDISRMISHTWMHGIFPSGRMFQAFVTRTGEDQRQTAYISDGTTLEDVAVVKAPGWSGADGDPGCFALRLAGAAGPVTIDGTTLGPGFHWTAESPWEIVIGADLARGVDANGWPCIERFARYEWDGEVGYGLLEATMPRPAPGPAPAEP